MFLGEEVVQTVYEWEYVIESSY